MFHERLQKLNTLNKMLSLKYRNATEVEFNVPKCTVYPITMSPLNIRVIQGSSNKQRELVLISYVTGSFIESSVNIMW